jgi:hypothetical protein
VNSPDRATALDAAVLQLQAEEDWLAGRHLPESFQAMLPKPSQAEQEINNRVLAILSDAGLTHFLRIIEQHNSQAREVPGRRRRQKDFLLAPHVRLVLTSVQEDNEKRTAAEVRNHLQKVAAGCKALATLTRKGPQPHIVLAAETSANEALEIFAPWTELFEAADGCQRQVVPFAELLQRADDWFSALARRVLRAPQNRHTGKGALRYRAAQFLPAVFRRQLGRPYHAHVATIATIMSSGIPTDADFVKKVENQQTGRKRQELGKK